MKTVFSAPVPDIQGMSMIIALLVTGLYTVTHLGKQTLTWL